MREGFTWVVQAYLAVAIIGGLTYWFYAEWRRWQRSRRRNLQQQLPFDQDADDPNKEEQGWTS